MSLHPIKTTEHIRSAYLRYLKTIKPFQEDWLRKAFAEAIEEENLLVKGPFVEISPPFEPGVSLRDLVREEILSPLFERLCTPNNLPYKRALYKHQEIAIRKVVAGRNIIVATGTGSGKTETFLIPILNSLLREQEQGRLHYPGVRTLLLYPMNALANDQMKRLRGLLRNFQSITFGRYVGETAQDPSEARELFRKNFPEETPAENELLSRKEMQVSPPHILLTNYAMLEYLLLRPADSTFFDGPTGDYWRFIVIDEAHVYDGANATEMAMLLRRLQDRIRRPGQKLQCIATSATLGGPEDYSNIVQFANGLLNPSFEWQMDDTDRQDVVSAARMSTQALGQTWGRGTPELYRQLYDFIDTRQLASLAPGDLLQRVSAISRSNDIPADILAHTGSYARQDLSNVLPRFLYALLKGDENVHRLQTRLRTDPDFLDIIAPEIFPETQEPAQAVVDLVALSVIAKANPGEMPLLPARYHVFARALEGAFLCLNEVAHRESGAPRLFLRRFKFCPHCGSRVFELANCTRCGEAYLIGNETPGRELKEGKQAFFKIDPECTYLTQSSVVYDAIEARQTSYFVLGQQLPSMYDEDEAVSANAGIDAMQDDARLDPRLLCPVCGMVRSKFELERCSCGVPEFEVSQVDIGQKKTLQRCVSCSTQGSSGVVYRFLTGQDAPVSVLASALYQHLPGGKDSKSKELPGEGRKLLNFTDNRQNAAFFAPYLERSHLRNMRRRLIMLTLEKLTEQAARGDLRLQDLVDRLVARAEEAGVFTLEQSLHERKRTAAIWLMLEFSPLDRRISLEGLGVLRIRPVRPPQWSAPNFLKEDPWRLADDQAFDLIHLLLNTLRGQGAVTYLIGEDDIARNEAFAPRNKAFYFRREGSNPVKGIFGWLPAEGFSNARLDLLKRFLIRRGFAEPGAVREAKKALVDLWEYLSSSNSPWRTHLPGGAVGDLGVLYRIAHTMWELQPDIHTPPQGWYICDRCQNISPVSLEKTCPTFGCSGELEPLERHAEALESNLYRDIYLRGDPIPLSAEEHTAQWTQQAAAEVQNRFIRGELNLLSCSTTFELGVDVGDLQAVVMRNVPPSTANYVQRAGRAGRRTDSAAFALTFAQRRSHDLNYYRDPKRMIAGRVKPPVVTLTNEKIIGRHLRSVVFAAFFRWAKEQHERTFSKVGQFFAPDNKALGPELLCEFLDRRPEPLRQALQRIIPPDLHASLGVADWTWIGSLMNSDKTGDLDKAIVEIDSELAQFEELVNGAVKERKFKQADYFSQVMNQIRDRDLLGFLGSRNVLPKYGFPTDVVELKTNHLSIFEASRIELDRDLRVAISEFAPGGEVVAAKRVWVSQGIRRLPNHEWEPFNYVVCGNCNKFYYNVGDLQAVCSCGHSLTDKPHLRGQFIIPEDGFIAAPDTRSPGDTPPKRTYASRVYFAERRLSDGDLELDKDPLELDGELSRAGLQIYKRYSRRGWLALVNKGFGQGFRVCLTCGYAEPVQFPPAKTKEHKNPLSGKSCKGTLKPFHLGHHFMTDILEVKTNLPLLGDTPTFSLLYALLDGASHALEIRRDDIDGTIYPQGLGEPPALILYDNVPGGAGHVKRIHENLRPVVEAALDRVARCECGEETSCYNCLRNYRNQFFHDILQRGSAIKLLNMFLGS